MPQFQAKIIIPMVLVIACITWTGCDVDPDQDGLVVHEDAFNDTTPPDTEEDLDGDDADGQDVDGDDVDGDDADGQDVDGDDVDGDTTDTDNSTIGNPCSSHCHCNDGQFCDGGSGTCQYIVVDEGYYCCSDSPPDCPQGQECQLDTPTGGSGTCGG